MLELGNYITGIKTPFSKLILNASVLYMKKKEICIVLPTLNEALSIEKVLEEIPKQALEEQGYKVEVVLVDGRSTDGTLEIAQKRKIKILYELRKGKGRAVRTALETIKSDYIFMLDADYTYPSTYILPMVEALKSYPVVIGSRLKGKREKGSIKSINIIGNYMLTWLASLLFKTRISDLCTGFWGFRQSTVGDLDLTSEGFQLEADFFTQLAKKGYKIGEVPIIYRARIGKAKLGGIKDGLKIALFLIRRRLHS
jgi:glycosyltransferase involved in cell wall biosynthesis